MKMPRSIRIHKPRGPFTALAETETLPVQSIG